MFLLLTHAETDLLYTILTERLYNDSIWDYDSQILKGKETLLCINLLYDIAALKNQIPLNQLIEISIDTEHEIIIRECFWLAYGMFIYGHEHLGYFDDYDLLHDKDWCKKVKRLDKSLYYAFCDAFRHNDKGYKGTAKYCIACEKLKAKQQELKDMLSLDDESSKLSCYTKSQLKQDKIHSLPVML